MKRNIMVCLMLLSFVSASTLAQSIQLISKVADKSSIHSIGVQSKGITKEFQADIETNYKIVAAPSKVEDCPNKEKLVGLCNSILMRKEDKDPDSPYVYQYQRKIIEASCADMEKDSEAEISRKVNIMWNKYENDLLTCDDVNFAVSNGNILKYAVSRRLVSVVEDAAQVWKINLNRVDPSDKRTVLDYVQYQINTYKNTENEEDLKQYYDLLRKAGAKHASEIKK